MSMTIQSSIKDKMLAAQYEASKEENAPAKMLRSLDQQMEKKGDGGLYFMDRIWVPSIEYYKIGKLSRLYIDEIVARHRVHVSIISDRDGRFTSLFWQTLKKAFGTRLNMSRLIILKWIEKVSVPFRLWKTSLHGRKYRSPIIWAEIRESRLIGPELVQETTNKVVLIKERLKAAWDRQKSYVDNRLKPLELKLVIK
ncbi:putative reverse transcriptase domain-containing protein [Tanacetum coccineum]